MCDKEISPVLKEEKIEGKKSLIPFEVVDYYFNNGSLRKIAREFGIHYNTLWKWVKIYRENNKRLKEERILTGYRRPWNRTKREIEEKVVFLKEKEPCITVRKAKEVLEGEGIKISIKGIWSIWRRYGYAGFKREGMTNDFTEYIPWTKEAERKYKVAEELFKKGNLRDCARILNSIPSLPKNEILLKIPDRYLNLRRKIEKTIDLSNKLSLSDYLKRVRKLYKNLRKKNLNYSALRIGIKEVIALEWKGEMEEIIKRIKDLRKIFSYKNYKRDSYLLFEPRFTLLISEGIANCGLLNIRKAKEIISKCYKILKSKKNPSPYFMLDLATLYLDIWKYKKAERLIYSSISKVDTETKRIYIENLAYIYFIRGEYNKAFSILKEVDFYEWVKKINPIIYSSFFYLLKGKIQSALSSIIRTLKSSKRDNKLIFELYITLASIYSLLGERRKSQSILKRLLFFLEKNKLLIKRDLIKAIISPCEKIKENISPFHKLLSLILKGKYFSALNYAKNRGILTYFYKFLFLLPEVVNSLIEKGKKTYLPKQILKLPVFNRNVFVYKVEFLGKLRIKRIQSKGGFRKIYIRHNLSPKESAFLIYLALKMNEPGKEIPLEDIYKNFWDGNRNFKRNLSHLLLKIKRTLKIPSHLIELSHEYNYSVLRNNGIYFLTDYGEFEEALGEANLFLGRGEWRFAKREFIRAFNLVKGEPFKKMYDNFSDEMRIRILNRYEYEVLNFAKRCIERNIKDSKMLKNIITKADRVIKYSDEIKEVLEKLNKKN